MKIELDNPQSQYAPGQSIRGRVLEVDVQVQSISVRLVWFTDGKGDRDFAVIQSVEIDPEVRPKRTTDGYAFEFTLPLRPLSFQGTLITLTWAIEAVAFPSKTSVRVEFSLGSGVRLIDRSEEAKAIGFQKPLLAIASKSSQKRK